MKLIPRPSPQANGQRVSILLPVDAAYAFDYLSILYVKRDEGLGVDGEIGRVEAFLEHQVGNLRGVLASGAFKRLLIANQQVFDAIEKAHRNKISAREVQCINLRRFVAKRQLQEEFWPAAPLMEAKTALGSGARGRLTKQP